MPLHKSEIFEAHHSLTFMNLTNYFLKRPGKLLFFDGLGATLTTSLLLFIIIPNEHLFGFPTEIGKTLAVVASCFAVCSLVCAKLIKKNHYIFLQLIALANFTYCVITMGVLLENSDQITALGGAYFISEIAIILMIVFLELRVSSKLK